MMANLQAAERRVLGAVDLGLDIVEMIGQTLWTEFFFNRDWPVASAVAVALLALLVLPILLYERLQRRQLEGFH